jgi:hypothetical protein
LLAPDERRLLCDYGDGRREQHQEHQVVEPSHAKAEKKLTEGEWWVKGFGRRGSGFAV